MEALGSKVCSIEKYDSIEMNSWLALQANLTNTSVRIQPIKQPMLPMQPMSLYTLHSKPSEEFELTANTLQAHMKPQSKLILKLLIYLTTHSRDDLTAATSW